jgi:hypothetical protein
VHQWKVKDIVEGLDVFRESTPLCGDRSSSIISVLSR